MYVPTQQQIADLLTMGLGQKQYHHLLPSLVFLTYYTLNLDGKCGNIDLNMWLVSTGHCSIGFAH